MRVVLVVGEKMLGKYGCGGFCGFLFGFFSVLGLFIVCGYFMCFGAFF